jgi:hypothetical protein
MSPVDLHLKHSTAFDGFHRIAAGPLAEVALKVKAVIEGGAAGPVLIYSDSTGRVIDVDIRGSGDDVIARLKARGGTPPTEEPHAESDKRGRGRPKLGVVAREVTLLPRHWEWLNSQSGGASVALRKLVEEARRTSGHRDRQRAAQSAAYHFMSAIAGNLSNFEEAARALFAADRRKFSEMVAAWPPDVRDHAINLAFTDLDPAHPAQGA